MLTAVKDVMKPQTDPKGTSEIAQDEDTQEQHVKVRQRAPKRERVLSEEKRKRRHHKV